MIELYNEDCLEVMKAKSEGSEAQTKALTRPNPCREVSHTRRSAMMREPIDSPTHLNPSDRLPVGGAILWIEVELGKMVKATRTGFIANKNSQMGYELPDGTVLTGRYRWAYQ